MVKRAEDLDLREFRLSRKVRDYLKKKYELTSELVWAARAEVYNTIENPNRKNQTDKEFLKFIKVLDKKGYIRHDITPNIFNIAWLYREVYGRNYDKIVGPISFYDWLKTKEACTSYGELYANANRNYENYKNLSDETKRAINDELKAKLEPEELLVLNLKYGLDGRPDSTYSDEEVAKKLGRVPQYISKIVRGAIDKLKGSCGLITALKDNENFQA